MSFDLQSTLYSLPGIIAGLTLHEYCHARAAYALGDGTAKEDGRLSFNPLRHIDPLGLIFIVVAGFGWAKPVSFREDKLAHPRRDKALIAFAGPLSNLLLGIAMLFCAKLWIGRGGMGLSQGTYTTVAYVLLYAGVINLSLFVFNMLPLPPLDGSHIFLSGLNLKPETEQKFMRWGSVALIAIILAERALDVTIIPIHLFTGWVMNLILG